MSNSHMSPAQQPCYDGESQPDETVEVTDTTTAEPSDTTPVEPETPEPETPEPEPLTFTEADVEARIAERLAAVELDWKNQLGAKDAELSAVRAKFDAATLERSLADAAKAGDAINSEVILAFLRPFTHINDGTAVVEIEGFTLSPSEAVQWMRAQVDRFGCLFKANMVSGIGGHSAAGGAKATRTPDVRTLGPAEYRKMKKENPEAYGFRGVG